MKKSEPKLGSRLLIGAIAGLAGTLAMGAAMRRTRRPRLAGKPKDAPEDKGEDAPPPNTLAKDVTTVGDFVYGAASGALLGAANIMIGPVAGGTAGLSIWLAGYLGWIPKPDDEEPGAPRRGRHTMRAIVSHVLWGSATAAAMRELNDARDTILAAAGKDRPKSKKKL